MTVLGHEAAPGTAAAQRADRPGRDARALGLVLALTFSTGVVDAVGYLALDRVFVGNMTGNVVILGMAVTGAEDLPVVGPVLALAAFLAGAAAAGRALRRSPAAWSGRTSVLLAVVSLLVAAVTSALATGAVVPTVRPGAAPELGAPLLVVTAGLGMAMGVQAATARALAVRDVTTVVVTSTLTALAADSRLAGGSGTAWRRRAAAVALIVLGAAAGAALLRVHPAAALGLSALVTAVVAVIGHLAVRDRSRTGDR